MLNCRYVYMKMLISEIKFGDFTDKLRDPMFFSGLQPLTLYKLFENSHVFTRHRQQCILVNYP